MLAALLALLSVGCTSAEVGSEESFETEAARQELAQVFLVEHFNVEVSGQMLGHLRNNPPGGILFWNGNAADATTLRGVIQTYSEETKAAGHPPVLFSADYEGGGNRGSATSLDPRGYQISGVQRFRKGFTALVHPRWMGAAYDVEPELGLELARLHGTIMARELRTVGLVLPLSVVGDLAKGLMKVRGMHPDPAVVSALIQEMLRGFFTEPGMIFNTKHFPGLGDGEGDTHDQVVTIHHDAPTAAQHLQPFEAAIAASDDENAMRLSMMCGHARYPLFDADNMTTVSPAILQGLLRDELGFGGLSVSDAMWMGPYGQMSGKPLYRVYLQSFLAGMDLLMIPGSKFTGALSYFESVLNGTLSTSEVAALEELLETDIDRIVERMESRLDATLERMDATKATMTFAADVTSDIDADPTTFTEEERARYYAILEEIDPRWEGRL